MFDLNSGYVGSSRSVRSEEAISCYEVPISMINKSLIDEFLEENIEEFTKEQVSFLKKVSVSKWKYVANIKIGASSWHHTSSYFNKTNHYALNSIATFLLDNKDTIDESYILFKAREKELKEVIKKNEKNNKFRGNIEYLDWSGSRNHPKATKCTLNDVNIEEKGSYYIITDNDGNQILKKKVGSNGTYVTNYKEDEERKKNIEEREKSIQEKSSKKALEFFHSLSMPEYSSSNHIYASNRKPSRYDYEMGIEKFFNIGEHRLYKDINLGVLYLETWNGTDWVMENKK